MKTLLLLSSILICALSSAQNKTATTDDGRKVLLKKNNTWEYIESKNKNTKSKGKGCDLQEDQSEKVNERLRKHVAVENDCGVEDVKFISMTQGFGNGMYSLCVKGQVMKYKKVGTVFLRAESNPLGD